MQPRPSTKNPKLGHTKTPKLEHKKEEEEEPTAQSQNCPFLLCADLILPWLTPQELATISLTSKPLSHLSKTLTLRRTLDASRSFETFPIPFINTIDSHPYAYFPYTPSQILPLHSTPLRQRWPRDLSPNPNPRTESNLLCLVEDEVVGDGGGLVLGCGCERCDFNSECPCSIGSVIDDALSECGTGCGCGMECENRVSQRGVSVRLKIVRVERKGWGLFADEFIKQGQFVCEYAGELLTTEEARMRQQKYDDLATAGQFSSALLVVREHLPSRKACLRINIDATRVGNVARFINHSCDGGNLSTVVVRRTGALLPHLCFFASKDIKENTELSFSYGDIRLKSNGITCFCGSSSCRGTLPSEHT